MKTLNYLGRLCFVAFLFLVMSAFYSKPTTPAPKFPFKAAGLTEREAAAHLLNRFTYGATPEQVDAVVKMGLENWFESQLKANNPNDSLNMRLSAYPDLSLNNEQIIGLYPKSNQILRMAVKDGVINGDSIRKVEDKKAYKRQINAYMLQKGIKPETELYKQFISSHILRAVYSQNQLQEVLTDFWFNHFNVSFTKGDAARFIPSFERDVIRPNVTAKFDKLLLATAKSPAMLYFLDNFISVKSIAAKTPAANTSMPPAGKKMNLQKPVTKPSKTAKDVGLNENYAREIMELHTLGVDGGYTQSDVTEAARVLTGWTVDASAGGLIKKYAGLSEEEFNKRGFIKEGDFLFAANKHDQGEKTVLGRKFKANGGYQEGVDLLEMLAHNPSTAKFISTKLAVRFVSDTPPASLINKMIGAFLEKDGDISQVLLTMVNAPEFWSPQALRQKTKSPFEYAISAVRGLNATVNDPYQLFNWISRMGQRIYYYQAPTGFPDKGQYWINTGALLNRMNFGLALTAQKIPGIKVNLLALNKFHEPESANAAMVAYSKLLIPERNLEKTFKQLTPMLKDPELTDKVDHAAAVTPANPKNNYEQPLTKPTDKNAPERMLAQVVGVVIGSPEFQRR